MEVPSAPPAPVKWPKGGKRSNKCRNVCIAVSVVAVILILVMLVLALTVFKAKKPVIAVNSIYLQDLDVSLDVAQMRTLLNLTIGTDISVKNPNKVGVKYSNGSALIGYHGETVGEVPIPAGRITADGTEDMKLAVTVMADRFLSNPRTFSDIMAGVLPLTATAKISGKVSILSVIRIHVTAAVSCNVNVFISNRTIDDHQCKYKTKL